MSNYLDDVHNSIDAINDCAYELKALGNAFYVTGNKEAAIQLEGLSAELISSSKTINKAIGDEISAQLKQSQQSAANTIRACLAMSELKDSSE